MPSRQLPSFLPQWRILTPALWLGFIVWAAVLFIVSSLPGIPGPELPLLGIDKLQHFLFFASGAIVFGAALRATFHIHWAALFLIVIVSLSFLGLADETHQLFVANRSGGDPFDWLADLIGTSSGLIILRSFYAKRPPENPAAPAGD